MVLKEVFKEAVDMSCNSDYDNVIDIKSYLNKRRDDLIIYNYSNTKIISYKEFMNYRSKFEEEKIGIFYMGIVKENLFRKQQEEQIKSPFKIVK